MRMSFEPSGVVTITTDFGHQGPFVGVMKGRIYTRCPEARIVDLTHEILVHWPVEAGFWLERAYEYFPRGTVHIAVVDPGVGTSREIACVELDGHVFLAPDNGLLGALASRHPDALCRHLAPERLAALGLSRPSATFHGRDIFAPIAAELAAGRLQPDALGPRVAQIVPGWVDDAEGDERAISGVVITLDHFGNLITNIEAGVVLRMGSPRIYAASHSWPLSRTYGDVRPGELLALVNSFGVIEIARAEGSAAEALGLSRGAPVVVRDTARLP